MRWLNENFCLLPHMSNCWRKTDFGVKEEWENDWMSLICSFMHKFKCRLDWILYVARLEFTNEGFPFCLNPNYD